MGKKGTKVEDSERQPLPSTKCGHPIGGYRRNTPKIPRTSAVVIIEESPRHPRRKWLEIEEGKLRATLD